MMPRIARPFALRILAATLVALAGAAAAAAADFAWQAPLRLEGRSGLYVAAATPAFYAGVARADLGDVRVRNAAGEAVPYAIRVPAPPPAEAPPRAALPMFPLWAAPGVEAGALSVRIEQNARGAIVGVEGAQRSPARARLAGYLLDASALDTPVDALHLEWDGTGFAGRVRVEASDDLDRWSTRAADAPLMALAHDGQTLSARRIAIPGTRARYLRVSWPAVQETPSFRAVLAEAPAAQPERARVWQPAEAAPGERSQFAFDLGGHPPVDRLRIELPMNAVLPVEVLSRNDRAEPWRHAASVTLYRLERAGTVLTRDEAAFGARSDRYWMVRVDPRAGVDGGLLRVSAGYVPHEIVFAARGDAPFTLAFGDAGAASAALPVTTLIPGYREAAPLDAARAVLEPPQAVPRAARRWPEWLDLDRVDAKRAALWGVLIAGVGALAILAWRLARQVS